jgi:23S rRNA G2445 N2-methylase RlmL
VTDSEPKPPPPELARCLSEPGYTPPARSLEALLAVLIALPDEAARQLERALARAAAPALHAAAKLVRERDPHERPRLIGLFARFAGELDAPELGALLLAALDEPLPQSRKLAARGLAKLGDARAEPRLLAALERARGPELKSIVDALAALGTERSLQRLATLEAADPDLVRRRERARALIERRLGRAEPDELILDAPLGAPWRVALSCRAGLAEVLADELRAFAQPVVRNPERVDIEHAGSLRALLVARTAIDVALALPLKGPIGREPADHIADALASAECVAALTRWTRGAPRFRVTWTSGGHRRGLTWALDRALHARTTAISNDSRGARWTLRAPPDAEGELLLVPRLTPDPRFAYRVADVPASSHPTIAAALARVAGVAPDEVVWDPFVGSGLELIERARLGPVSELWGSDIDPRALEAARQNLAAAGVAARLVEQSALAFQPPAPSLIITNPPMGRRVARDGSVGELLEGFVRHAAKVLRPAGRLVWLSPFARRTERVARSAGLEVQAGPEIDLGGFSAHVQVCRRPP